MRVGLALCVTRRGNSLHSSQFRTFMSCVRSTVKFVRMLKSSTWEQREAKIIEGKLSHPYSIQTAGSNCSQATIKESAH